MSDLLREIDNIRKGKVTMPIPSFEIFLKEADGNVLWRGSAESLEHAKERVKKMGATAPGRYMIWNHTNGETIFLEAGG
jgi:hypothetical protein